MLCEWMSRIALRSNVVMTSGSDPLFDSHRQKAEVSDAFLYE